MFFLWELKSEAQTLILIIYQCTFSFGPFPCYHQRLFFWSFQGRGPPLLPLTDTHPQPFSSFWAFCFFTPWQDSYFLSAHSLPWPRSGWALGWPVGLHLLKLVLFIFWQWKCEGPKLSSHTFSQPTGICRTHLRKSCLSLFQTLIPACFDSIIVTVPGSTYEIWFKKTFVPLWLFFGGSGF